MLKHQIPMKIKNKILKSAFLIASVILGATIVKTFLYSSSVTIDSKDDDHREFVKKNYRIFSLATPDTVTFACPAGCRSSSRTAC